MIPLAAIGLGVSAASTIFQGAKGLQQTREAKEMQKNLGPRVNYQIPEEARKALGLYQNMAVSQSMPGQQLMQNMIDMQQAKAVGGATRAATSSQDLLGVMSNLGEQGMQQQQELGLAAAQNYTQRQQDLAGAYGTMAGYQEKVNADKQQDWYERAAAAREMREAGLQNTMGAVQGLGQMGMMAAMGGMGGEQDPRTPIGDIPTIQSKSAPQLPGASGGGLMGMRTFTGRNVFTPGSPGSMPAGQLPVGGLAPIQSALGNSIAAQNMINAQNQRETGFKSFSNQYFMNPLFQ
jgi:hypothetical protein